MCRLLNKQSGRKQSWRRVANATKCPQDLWLRPSMTYSRMRECRRTTDEMSHVVAHLVWCEWGLGARMRYGQHSSSFYAHSVVHASLVLDDSAQPRRRGPTEYAVLKENSRSQPQSRIYRSSRRGGTEHLAPTSTTESHRRGNSRHSRDWVIGGGSRAALQSW